MTDVVAPFRRRNCRPLCSGAEGHDAAPLALRPQPKLFNAQPKAPACFGWSIEGAGARVDVKLQLQCVLRFGSSPRGFHFSAGRLDVELGRFREQPQIGQGITNGVEVLF